MSNALHGFPQSSYVWTARAGLTLAGVEFDFVPLTPGEHKQPEHLARHPFGVVPALVIDGTPLYETSAILRWADAVGSTRLFPSDPLDAARAEQWISVANAYLYSAMISRYVLKYIFAGEGGPDRADIDAVVPVLEQYVGILEAGIDGDGPWLVGSAVSAADLMVGPLLFGISRLPEGKAILGKHPKCMRLIGALAETPAFMSAVPRI